MTWYHWIFVILGLALWSGSILGAVWLTAKISRGEPLEFRPKPPPSPIVDTPAERDKKRKVLRDISEVGFTHG